MMAAYTAGSDRFGGLRQRRSWQVDECPRRGGQPPGGPDAVARRAWRLIAELMGGCRADPGAIAGAAD